MGALLVHLFQGDGLVFLLDREPKLGLEGVVVFVMCGVRGRVDGEELVVELCVGGVKGWEVDFVVAGDNVKLVNFRAKIKLDNCKINTYRDDHALHSSQPPQLHTSSDCSPSPHGPHNSHLHTKSPSPLHYPFNRTLAFL